MKKKIFEKILTIGSATIAVVFVIVLLITIFGGIETTEFDNSLVRGLFIALGAVFLLSVSGTIAYQFIDTDAVKEIVINSDKQTSTKASASVIKKLAKQNIATIEGVKCTKVIIALTEYGVRLKVGIKVVDKDVQEIAAVLKCLLEDVYYETLGYKFYAIDFKILSLKTTYTADMTSVEEKAKKNVEAQKAAQEAEELEREEAAFEDAAVNGGTEEVKVEKTEVKTVEKPKAPKAEKADIAEKTEKTEKAKTEKSAKSEKSEKTEVKNETVEEAKKSDTPAEE